MDALPIDAPALVPQQRGDSPIAVARMACREFKKLKLTQTHLHHLLTLCTLSASGREIILEEMSRPKDSYRERWQMVFRFCE